MNITYKHLLFVSLHSVSGRLDFPFHRSIQGRKGIGAVIPGTKKSQFEVYG